MKNKDLLIAVDIALNTSGYVVMGMDKKLHASGLIESKKHWDYYRKVEYLYKEFYTLFEFIYAKQPKTLTLILEGRLKGGFSGQTLASIEGARIAAYLAYNHMCKLHEIDVNSFVYNPNEVKYHFTKRRGAKKDQMFKAATSRFSSLSKIEFQEDIFDAIYLGIYHLERKEV